MPKQLHSLQYPTLSRIARDYLPIQGSAVPSERAFSSGGITSSTLRRNLLAPSTFGALQLLKAAYKNDHISAVSEAQSYAYPERVPRVSGCLNFALHVIFTRNFMPTFGLVQVRTFRTVLMGPVLRSTISLNRTMVQSLVLAQLPLNRTAATLGGLSTTTKSLRKGNWSSQRRCTVINHSLHQHTSLKHFVHYYTTTQKLNII
jgi:hypothetical protein